MAPLNSDVRAPSELALSGCAETPSRRRDVTGAAFGKNWREEKEIAY